LVKLELYRQFYDVSSIEDLVKLFQEGLVVTNRTADFFVDWEKVKRHVDDIKIELSLWNSLIGSSDIESDFIHLIKAYPEVIKTIPILAAIRDREFPVIIDFFDIEKGIKEMDFNKNRSFITESETRDYVNFGRNAGIFLLFDYIKNFYDYVLGVEVGMDTHARKNRSGKAMELLLKPIVEESANRLGCNVLFQNKFKSVAPWGKVPHFLANRKSDFIIYSDTKLVNIEVNYIQEQDRSRRRSSTPISTGITSLFQTIGDSSGSQMETCGGAQRVSS